MSLADDLLDLAKKMVNYKKADVVDARLRRGISTAYYALFHLLVESSAAEVVRHARIGKLVSRAYSHGDMNKAARTFKQATAGLPDYLTAPFGPTAPPVPQEIVDVATAFVALQEARHDADYNLSKTFVRAEARALVAQADKAFTDWKAVVAMPLHAEMCELFLTMLLLGERWRK